MLIIWIEPTLLGVYEPLNSNLVSGKTFFQPSVAAQMIYFCFCEPPATLNAYKAKVSSVNTNKK